MFFCQICNVSRLPEQEVRRDSREGQKLAKVLFATKICCKLDILQVAEKLPTAAKKTVEKRSDAKLVASLNKKFQVRDKNLRK